MAQVAPHNPSKTLDVGASSATRRALVSTGIGSARLGARFLVQSEA